MQNLPNGTNQQSETDRMQDLAGFINNEQMEAERLKAQRDLANSNDRFIYASQATSDAIWDRNYSDDEFFWGDGFKTLFGYPVNAETKSIQFWESRIHPDDRERVTQTIQEAKNNPESKTWYCEYRFLKADGNYAFVHEKAIILRDENGQPARTIGALQDITENKRTEVILKELNENLEKEKYFMDSLMNNLPDSIYFKDRESRLIRVSKYMADKFGCTMEDMIGKTDFDIQDIEHARDAFRDEQEIIETGKPKIDFVEKATAKNGTVRWLSTTKMPLINERNEIVGTFGISKNVTAIKNLEDERHAALLDKAVAQGKFEIASGVMHDIGNAVTGFGSYLTRIRRLQEEEKSGRLLDLVVFFEQQQVSIASAIGEAKAAAVVKMLSGIANSQRENQAEINKSISEQLNIISHIQEILNIQRQYINGHESQERKLVNLKSMVNDSLSMLFAQIDKQGIQVSLDFASELPLIKGDRTKLMQVILNILKNGIEAVDKNTGDKQILINAHLEEDQLMLCVKDNGSGFDASAKARFFNRGFTTKNSGSGLGLYNCRSIIESHEGTIDITSEGTGMGASITIGFKAERKVVLSAA